jgi:hypothetical protein
MVAKVNQKGKSIVNSFKKTTSPTIRMSQTGITNIGLFQALLKKTRIKTCAYDLRQNL